MAIFKTSGIIGAISGSFGGVTFQKNNVLKTRQRKKVARTKSNTEVPLKDDTTQTAPFYNLMPYCANKWRSLTTDQLLQWNAAAKNFSTSNSLNVSKTISAYNLFVKLNSAYLYLNPGSFLSEPPIMVATSFPSEITVTSSSSKIQLIKNETVTGTNVRYHILGARSYKTGKPRSYRFFKFVTIQDQLPLTGASVRPEFGFWNGLPSNNEWLGIKVRVICNDRMPSAWRLFTLQFQT